MSLCGLSKKDQQLYEEDLSSLEPNSGVFDATKSGTCESSYRNILKCTPTIFYSTFSRKEMARNGNESSIWL